MCGIGGYYARGTVTFDERALLEQMTTIEFHRGPDGKGQWISPDRSVGLCHTRLSIIDLTECGAQPMPDSAQTLMIVFNGEIYNFQELRQDLLARGYSFRGHSDTEVLLAAYREYGEGVLERLRGMFAFAIYDKRDGTLFCARDRIGKKPFVFSESPHGFFFGSEIPALKLVPGADLRPDKAAIAGMLLNNMRHIPDPHTAYVGIRRLRAGHCMRVQHGRIVATRRWWTPSATTSATSADALREILEDSVRHRMIADVPVGALLSGGVDSTAIVNLMQRDRHEPVRTYALGLDASDEDLRRAREAAAYLGCTHREFYFDPARQLDVLQQLLQTYGEPIMLLPLVHTYELCRAIRDEGIRVVLTGHGADELFYGYEGHFRTADVSDWLHRIEGLASLVPGRIRRSGLIPRAARFALAPPGQRKAQYYIDFASKAWEGILTPAARAGLRNVVSEELEYWGALVPSPAFIDESNFCGLLIENTHSVTTAADLPAMLASVEVRSPFLDMNVIEFALAVHYREKVPRKGGSQNLKKILRQAVRDLVPADLLNAPKRGFGNAIQEDSVFRGPWRDFGHEMLSSADDVDGLFDPKGVAALWNQFLAGRAELASTVARLSAIQYWAKCSNDTRNSVGRRNSGLAQTACS